MLTLRCRACDAELSSDEMFLSKDLKDYNDLCTSCLESISGIVFKDENTEAGIQREDDYLL